MKTKEKSQKKKATREARHEKCKGGGKAAIPYTLAFLASVLPTFAFLFMSFFAILILEFKTEPSIQICNTKSNLSEYTNMLIEEIFASGLQIEPRAHN